MQLLLYVLVVVLPSLGLVWVLGRVMRIDFGLFALVVPLKASIGGLAREAMIAPLAPASSRPMKSPFLRLSPSHRRTPQWTASASRYRPGIAVWVVRSCGLTCCVSQPPS